MLKRLFGDRDDRGRLLPLYRRLVAEARQPFWYREGQVPDTLDGRFDMVAALLAITLLRIEQDGEPGRAPAALLTELFVDDMDGQLRQIGIGDIVVGKHIGKMMAALGGRFSAYREGLAEGGDLEAALTRNLYRGSPPETDVVGKVATRLRGFADKLARTSLDALLKGDVAA